MWSFHQQCAGLCFCVQPSEESWERRCKAVQDAQWPSTHQPTKSGPCDKDSMNVWFAHLLQQVCMCDRVLLCSSVETPDSSTDCVWPCCHTHTHTHTHTLLITVNSSSHTHNVSAGSACKTGQLNSFVRCTREQPSPCHSLPYMSPSTLLLQHTFCTYFRFQTRPGSRARQPGSSVGTHSLLFIKFVSDKHSILKGVIHWLSACHIRSMQTIGASSLSCICKERSTLAGSSVNSTQQWCANCPEQLYVVPLNTLIWSVTTSLMEANNVTIEVIFSPREDALSGDGDGLLPLLHHDDVVLLRKSRGSPFVDLELSDRRKCVARKMSQTQINNKPALKARNPAQTCRQPPLELLLSFLISC